MYLCRLTVNLMIVGSIIKNAQPNYRFWLTIVPRYLSKVGVEGLYHDQMIYHIKLHFMTVFVRFLWKSQFEKKNNTGHCLDNLRGFFFQTCLQAIKQMWSFDQ